MTRKYCLLQNKGRKNTANCLFSAAWPDKNTAEGFPCSGQRLRLPRPVYKHARTRLSPARSVRSRPRPKQGDPRPPALPEQSPVSGRKHSIRSRMSASAVRKRTHRNSPSSALSSLQGRPDWSAHKHRLRTAESARFSPRPSAHPSAGPSEAPDPYRPEQSFRRHPAGSGFPAGFPESAEPSASIHSAAGDRSPAKCPDSQAAAAACSAPPPAWRMG